MIFLVRSRLPVVCKLVCFPFAACLPWSASAMESIVKQLELHLGPFWSCCNLQAPAGAQLGGHRGGTGWATKQLCWVTPWAAVGQAGQPPHTAAPAQGSRPGPPSMGLGDLFPRGNSRCWSQWVLWWDLRLFCSSACCWACGGSLPVGSCFQKCSWYSWRVSGAKATSRGRTATSQCPQGRSTSRCSDRECSFLPAPHLPGQQCCGALVFKIFNYCG